MNRSWRGLALGWLFAVGVVPAFADSQPADLPVPVDPGLESAIAAAEAVLKPPPREINRIVYEEHRTQLPGGSESVTTFACSLERINSTGVLRTCKRKEKPIKGMVGRELSFMNYVILAADSKLDSEIEFNTATRGLMSSWTELLKSDISIRLVKWDADLVAIGRPTKDHPWNEAYASELRISTTGVVKSARKSAVHEGTKTCSPGDAFEAREILPTLTGAAREISCTGKSDGTDFVGSWIFLEDAGLYLPREITNTGKSRVVQKLLEVGYRQ